MTKDTLFAVLIAVVWAVVVVVLNWGGWKLDTTALYFAAKSFGAGELASVYDPGPLTYLTEPPQSWIAWAEADGWDSEILRFTPYLYPPLWVAVLAPIAGAVTSTAFFDAVLLINVAATIWMVWLAYRLVRPERIGPIGWSAWSFGLMIGTIVGYLIFWLGQPQVVVSALTLAAFVAMANNRDITAGGALALAAALKLSPVLLVVLFVMEKRWKALAAFAVVGAALGGLSILVAGWPLHADMLTKIKLIEENILVSRILVGLELPLWQLGQFVTGQAKWSVGVPYQIMEPAWITWTVRSVLIIGLAAVWWTTRDVGGRLRIWLRVLGVVMVTLLTNPLGWLHYLVLPYALLPGFYELMDRKTATRILGGIFIITSMPFFLFAVGGQTADYIQVAINVGVVALILGVVLRRAIAEANP